ncbi:hypothetical protein B0H66DRAFT_607745 [Apodospora peruviana]|uniref:Uncharacterized protein n=1 Tax=Apodospora peruviana TaxID=516989 RepID=A0AAE0HTP2_9PEZI|nr:hypothetical protein B0H66DRAFT_607745 [Apodospora peruviana]
MPRADEVTPDLADPTVWYMWPYPSIRLAYAQFLTITAVIAEAKAQGKKAPAISKDEHNTGRTIIRSTEKTTEKLVRDTLLVVFVLLLPLPLAALGVVYLTTS